LNEKEIVIRALKMEAQLKPSEKIYAGWVELTYEEFGKMLDAKRLQRNHKKLVESIVQTSLKMFRENPVFRERMLKLAGEVYG
jgi:hypothetical protein